jgi:phospholipase D-like protein
MRVLLFVLATAVTVWALIECIQADDEQIRRLPKIGWILVILFAFFLGAVAWFFFGRPRHGQASSPAWGSRRGGAGAGPGTRRPAPDDDPDFLRRIGRDSEHEQMLRRWEEDLLRREREMQDPEDPEAPDPGPPQR